MGQDGLIEQLAAQIARERGKDGKERPLSTYERALRELRGVRFLDLTKDTQFSEAWNFLALILSLLGLIFDAGFMMTAGLAMWVVAAVGWTWNRLGLFGVHYERRFSEKRAFLGEEIELTLEVRNRKFLPLPWLQIIDIFPAGLPLAGENVRVNRLTNQGEFTSFWALAAFGRLTRRFVIQCTQRGYHGFGPARLHTGDAFGMFDIRGTLPLRERVIVYPRLYTVAELGLPVKNPFGERSSAERLFEDPLRTAGIRAWQPTDGLKRVHWKATARRQELLSRLYEPSAEPHALIFLNVATLRRHWEGNIPELLERAISVAGSLAALCAEMRLPVGLIANGYLPESDQPLRLLPGRSLGHIVRILELLAAVTPFAAQPIEQLLLREAPRLPWGATLLVVTAIAHEELLATLLDLTRAGRQVVLFTLAEKPPAELLPGVVVYHLPHLVADLVAPTLVQAS